ncbi:hypothetical protein Bca101_021556 [Brassica carinata]
MDLWRKKKKQEKEKEKEKQKGMVNRCLLRSGSIFLEKLIADCNGISNPIRMFSPDQISKATDHFDPKCYLGKDWVREFPWYKGNIEGRPYTIKRYTDPRVYRRKEEIDYNDIALSTRVSNHSGFLKLIGCCLEFGSPVLVFEDLGYTVLNVRGTVGSCLDVPLLPWNVRLKIAKDIANAITYLHTAFPRIIIHRNILPTNVFLDKNGKAKLTDLSNAITLPEGKSWLDQVPLVGTIGYIDPTYFSKGILTEYSDVYNFGILMLVLLMGRLPFSQLLDGKWEDSTNIVEYVRDLHERGEPVEFGGDSNDMKPDQMKMFLELALRCCEEKNVDRPKMITVAKEIKLIEKGSFDSEILENGRTASSEMMEDCPINNSSPLTAMTYQTLS